MNLLSALMSPGGRLWTADYGSVVSINIFVVLLCACIVIGHLLEESRWMNESTTAVVIGLFTGGLLLVATGGKSSHILVFSEDLFFIYLLPPIIFNAGFQVKKKQFFHNFMTITLFGAIGTIISFTVISFGGYVLFKKLNIGPLKIGDFLAIGAIFSATDSVCTLQVLSQDETPLLYSLVFGEGVVNDAMSIVLFKTVQDFDLVHIDTGVAFQVVGNFIHLFLTSTILGVIVGLLSAYIIKKLYFGRHSTDREVAIMIVMAYFSYMLAELLYLSGILTVFFCGIVMSHYTWHNVTESSRITTKHVFATMSFIAEIFIFLYVGMDALDIEKWKCVSNSLGKSIGVSAILLVLVLIGRSAFIFPLSFLSNLFKNSQSGRINLKQQVLIWWAGLMRGAVSMALAYNQVFGLMTKPLISLILPLPAIPIQNTSSEHSNHKSLLSPLIGNGQASDSEKEGFVPLVQGSPTEQSVRGYAVK
ncbi:Sodium/hydrogen exchanger 2 [Acorus calamus]|uniref:Sodium/hydrogen exchanger 2 n=1 Tax=Acorus calamus TaxID=4465 RepID=A0AAV9CX29_ACOCL|nr:Sodium/hydrogen exchanger 2 [Acorus calamus]